MCPEINTAETVTEASPAKASKPAKPKKAPKAKAKKASTKKAAKTNGKPKSELTKVQTRILNVLSRNSKPLNRNEIAEKAEVDPTQIGAAVGYNDPKINARPVHANNLVNKKYVKIQQHEGEAVTYVITEAGKSALTKAKTAE